MKKVLLAGLVLGGFATAITPALAAPTTGPDGLGCGFASVTDPGTEGGDVQTGEVDGGPILGDGTLTCTIQVGSKLHSGPDAATAENSGTTVVVVPPTVVSYVSPPDVPVYLCTSWTPAGGSTIYADALTGGWDTSSSVECDLATSAGTSDPVFDPIFDAIDTAFDTLILVEQEADKTLCPALAARAPGVPGVVDIDSTGDVYVNGEFFWDCPPYVA